MKSTLTQRTLLSGSGLVIGAVLFFAVNIFATSGFQTARVDLTENQLYTLSEGTRNILANLEEPVTLRFYLSKKLVTALPGINSYANRVEELLEEFDRAAKGKLILHSIDPEPFSEAEDRAVGYGLQGAPLDDSGATTLYFGLVGTNSVDDEQVIPFFQPDRGDHLEYDLAKLVYQLANPKQVVIGLMSSLPLEGQPAASMFQPAAPSPLILVEQMRQLFDVRTLDTDIKEIPDDVDVLMIVHPKDFSDNTLYAIDQFVLGGGRTLAFVDPYAEADQPPGGDPMMAMQAPRNSELNKLFDAWGLSMESDFVAGDLEAAKKVQFNAGPRPSVIDYPVWMDLSQRHMAENDIITSNLGNLTVATAGMLAKQENATTEFLPLLQTGPNAAKFDTARLGLFLNPQDLVRGYQPEGQFTLAARVTGTVKSAFPDGPPPVESGDEADEEDTTSTQDREHLPESKEPINVIVVADTDMLQDRFWVQVQNFLGQRIAIPSAANGNFVISALDNLTGSNDLISVRNRGGFSRPFTRVKLLQQQAEQRFLEKEQQLQNQLQETERKINELQQNKQTDNALILSPEQQREVSRFRQEKIKIRTELRNVQHELRKNIERLEDWMMFLNIGLMPLLIGAGGIAVGIYRIRRKRAHKQSALQAQEAVS